MNAVGTYLVAMLQELEDVKNRLLAQVVVSVQMEQFLKMECAPIQAIAQVQAFFKINNASINNYCKFKTLAEENFDALYIIYLACSI